MEKTTVWIGLVLMSMSVLLGGCYESYATPRAASLGLYDIAGQETSKVVAPAAQFPATIAVARIQSCYGGPNSAAFYVVNNRALESKVGFDSLRKLQGVRDVVMMNSLLSSGLKSSGELRQAAQSLKADMVLIYTVDTLEQQQNWSTALSVFTLGLAPTVKVEVTTTITAILIGSQTGFLYGTFETTSSKGQPAAAITTYDAIGQCRNFTELDAMRQMLNKFPALWNQVLADNDIKSR